MSWVDLSLYLKISVLQAVLFLKQLKYVGYATKDLR
jgi:hypothetical protein